jgi:chromosome segregation ATPase
VIRRVNVVKGMMAEDRTIEEIQRSFARFKDDIDSVETHLRDLISGFEREAKAPTVAADGRRELEREITEAKRAAGELVKRIASLERLISARVEPASGRTAGGGSDLY